jgi:hypothetical protein
VAHSVTTSYSTNESNNSALSHFVWVIASPFLIGWGILLSTVFLSSPTSSPPWLEAPTVGEGRGLRGGCLVKPLSYHFLYFFRQGVVATTQLLSFKTYKVNNIFSRRVLASGFHTFNIKGCLAGSVCLYIDNKLIYLSMS